MGLLSSVSNVLSQASDPEVSNGLLRAGLAMLQSGADGEGFGAGIAKAGNAYLDARDAYKQKQIQQQQLQYQQQMQDLQLQQARQAQQDGDMRRQAISSFSDPELQRLFQIDPSRAMEIVAAQLKPAMPSDQQKLYAQYVAQTQAAGGKPMSILEFETTLKRAGAPSTTIAMPKAFNQEAGNLIAKRLDTAYNDALAAGRQSDNADRILSALNSNKAITGPMAQMRLGATRLADLLNLGGADSGQRLAQTQDLVRALADLTLQGRQQMHGQGAITDSESQLANKAVSGNFEMSPAELRSLAAAAKRVSDYQRRVYGQIRDTVMGDEEMRRAASLYPSLDQIIDITPPASAGAGNLSAAALEELKKRGAR